MHRTIKDITYEMGRTVRYLTEKERHWGSIVAFNNVLSFVEMLQDEVHGSKLAEKARIVEYLKGIEDHIKYQIEKTTNSEKNLEENHAD